IVGGICHAAGATYEFSYNLPYIPTVNDSACVAMSRKVTEKYLGNDLWFELPRASMGAEDFSYYLRAYPGVFCYLGIGSDCPAIHNPKFNFNDAAIRNGILFFTGMVLEMLENEK
ncbi:MAG: M20/M25/M40 family metallo-hydrolase, partial [Victivallaceae bacterium]